MAAKFNIPRTIEAAEKKLNSLGELATATEWGRAAIVAAYVEPRAGQGRRTSGTSAGSLESPTEFAKRGIHGLTSHHTVKLYHDAWFNILDEDDNVIGQRERPVPGRAVELPDVPWPPTRTGTDGYESEQGMEKTLEKLTTKHGADKVANTLATKAPEAVAKQASKPQVANKIVRDPAATKSVHQAQSAKTQEHIKARQKRIADAGAVPAAQTAAAVDAAQAAMQNQNWTPAYTRITQARGQMIKAWLDAIKEQSLNAFDRHLLGSDLPSLERFVDEVRAFVEAEDDPYDAVKEARAERHDEFNREMDEAEAGVDLDTGLDEIEAWANQGS